LFIFIFFFFSFLASPIEVQTAYQCACILRDIINPYLLRRIKSDVANELPKKTEQVLFCKITPDQRKKYEDYLKSPAVEKILDGERNALSGIDYLRKICNHPDLTNINEFKSEKNYGGAERSGKMKVLESLLPVWQQQGHRCLIFCQTRQMLDILEKFVKNSGYFFSFSISNLFLLFLFYLLFYIYYFILFYFPFCKFVKFRL